MVVVVVVVVVGFGDCSRGGAAGAGADAGADGVASGDMWDDGMWGWGRRGSVRGCMGGLDVGVCPYGRRRGRDSVDGLRGEDIRRTLLP